MKTVVFATVTISTSAGTKHSLTFPAKEGLSAIEVANRLGGYQIELMEAAKTYKSNPVMNVPPVFRFQSPDALTSMAGVDPVAVEYEVFEAEMDDGVPARSILNDADGPSADEAVVEDVHPIGSTRRDH